MEVNRAWLGLETDAGIRVRLGRQRINLANQRLVGGVGWRQNEQAFDALTVARDGERLDLFYAVLDNVNRIFGDDVPAGDHEQGPSHLLEAELALGANARLHGWHHVLDNEDAPAFSTRTTGLGLTGEHATNIGGREDLVLGWRLEHARQVDHADNPADLDARYWHLVGRIGWGDRIELRLGRELLSGDADQPGRAFRTPLATLHAFNGWADRFLATPDDGLDDRYLALAWRPGRWIGELRAHRFTAEDGSADHGRELDLHLGRSLGERSRADLFAAWFEGEERSDDEARFWVMLSAHF